MPDTLVDRPADPTDAPGPRLDGLRVAVLATMGVERVELEGPRDALDAVGATTHLVSPLAEVRTLDFPEWGATVPADVALDAARPDAYDALYIPGGIINPDLLRLEPRAVAFARAFFDAGKPVASMCHGPWVLITAGVARGRRIAAWPSLRADLENAGATYVDAPAVVDGLLVTSRRPDDIPHLNREMVRLFAARARAAATA